MARGRKRKSEAKRERNGRAQRASADVRRNAERSVAMSQPHRAWLKDDQRADQRAATMIGRLRLAGLISEPQYWAGEKWARLMHEFHIVLATPISRASSMSAMVAPGMETPAEADHLSAERPETEEERQDRVIAAFDAVCGRISAADLCLLDAACVHGRAIGDDAMDDLTAALDQLVRLWRLDDGVVSDGDEPPVKICGFMAPGARPAA